MIVKHRDEPVDLWYMSKAFDFDYSRESLWCLKGLHLIVRAIIVVSGWIPKMAFRAATTDVTWKGFKRSW